MTRRILRHFGWCLVLALLCCAALACGSAEEAPALMGLDAYLNDSVVRIGDDADVYFESAYTSDGEEAEIEYGLRIEGVTDAEESVDVSGIAADHRCFTVPASGLTPGHAYRAIVTASAEGYAPAEDSETFLMAAGRDGYAVWLEVNGRTEPVECLVNEGVDICVHAAGAQEILLGIGDFEAPRGGCAPDEGERHFDQGWGETGRRLVYARACFADEYTGEEFWVTSNAVPVTARAISDEKLPAPALTFDQAGTTVPRGTPLEITIDEQPDVENLLLVLQIWRHDLFFDMVYWDPVDYVDAYGSIRLPTANLPDSTDGGEYELFATWSAPGYLSESCTAQFHVQDADPQPTISLLTAKGGSTVAPHENFVISGFAPGADGVCLFEGWEIVEAHEGQQGIYSIRGLGELGERTYYLGALVNGVWRRLDDRSVTVSVESDDELPELDVTGLPDGYAVDEGGEFTLCLHMLDPDAYDEDQVWYDFYFTDVTDGWNDVDEITGFRLHEAEGEDRFEYTVRAGELQAGHAYCIRLYAGLYKYPMKRFEYRFMVVPAPLQAAASLTIQGQSASLTANVNEDLHVRVEAPGSTGLQILWDGEWRIVDRDARDYAGTWEFDWPLGSVDGQTIIARATNEYYDWIEDDYYADWRWEEECEFSAYTNPVTVTTNAVGKTQTPEISLAQATLARGDDLVICIPADHDVNLRYCDAGVFAENEWGEYWEWRDRNDTELRDGEAAQVRIPTIRLEPGRYRVQVNFQGKPGYENCETGYNDPDLYFIVTESEALEQNGALLKVTGAEVIDNGDGTYSVPTNARYVVSGALADADDVCLYERRDRVGEWFEESAFTWETSRGNVEAFVYRLGRFNHSTYRWEQIEDSAVTVYITCGEGQKLADPEVTAPAVALADEPYTFTFKEVPDADVYYVNVSCNDDHFGYEDGPIFEADIMPWEPGEEGYESGIHQVTLDDSGHVGYTYTIRVNALKYNWDQGYSEARYLCVCSDQLEPESEEPEFCLTLTQDGRAPSAQQPFLVNKDVDIEVRVAGGCSALEIYWNDNWERVDLNECYDWEEGVARMTWRYGLTGRYGIIARLTYNDIDPYDYDSWDVYWSRHAAPVEVEFAADGIVHAPDVTLSPKTVVRGETLSVNVGAMDEGDAANTEALRLRIHGVRDNNFWDWYYETEVQLSERTVCIPTAFLAPGRYRVHLDVEAKEGYAGGSTEPEDESLWFTVTEPAAAPAATLVGMLTGSATPYNTPGKVMQPQTMQLYRVSACVPGAERVCVFVNGEFWFDADGESLWFDDWSAYEDSFKFTVGRWDPATEDYIKVEGPELNVQIISDYSLWPPTIEVTNCAGDLVFDISDIDDETTMMQITVLDEDNGEIVYRDRFAYEAGEDEDPRVITVAVPADRLRAGDLYRIIARVWAPNRGGADAEAVALVTGETTEDVVLTVNDGTRRFSVNKEVPIQIVTSLTGEGGESLIPQEVQLYWNGGWQSSRDWNLEDDEDFEDLSDVEIRRSVDSSEYYTVQARVCLDAWDDDEDDSGRTWLYSNPVSLELVASTDEIPLPKVSVTPANADMGQRFNLTLSGMIPNTLMARCRQIDIQILSEQDGREVRRFEIPNDPQKPFTASKPFVIYNDGQNDLEPLEPGTYHVHVHMHGKEGYESRWTDWNDEQRFTVNNRLFIERWVYDPNEDDGIWQEVSSPVTLNTHDVYRIVGLTATDVPHCIFDGNDVVKAWDWTEGVYEYSATSGGETHTYYLGVGEWDNGNGWTRLDDKSVTVTINPAEGTLDAPVITSIPIFVEADFEDDFTFSFSGVENAGWYNIHVDAFSEDDDWYSVFDADSDANDPEWQDPDGILTRNPDGGFTVSIPREAFEDQEEGEGFNAREPGWKYLVSVAAHESGWNSGRTQRWVPVVGEPDENNAVRLSIEGEDENVTVNAGDRFNLLIEVDDQPYRVQLLIQDRWEELNEDTLGENWNWSWTFSHQNLEWDVPNESCTMMLRAIWDEDEDWVYGNPVNVTVNNLDQVGVPAVTIVDGLDANGKIARGDLLQLHFGPTPEHASEYHVRLRSVEERSYDEEFLFRFIDLDQVDPDGFDLNLSTAMLPEYNSYRVDVFVRGGDGYQSNQTGEYDPGLRFRVLPGEIRFTASKTEVRTQEPFTVSAYVPGADALYLWEINGNGEAREGGAGWIDSEFSLDQAGVYQFELSIWREDNDEYLKYGETITVTVTSDGPLGAPVITAPARIAAGDDLTFNVTVDDANAQYANVRVENVDDTWLSVLDLNDIDASTLSGEGRTFTVSYDDIAAQLNSWSDLSPVYRIGVYVWTPGYDASYAEQMVLVAPPTGSGDPVMTLTVNGQDGVNAETGEIERMTLLSSVDYRIDFSIDGLREEDVASIELFWDGYWQYMFPGVDYDGDRTGGWFTRSDGRASRDIIMRVSLNEDDSSYYYFSNVVPVEIVSEGAVAKPVIRVTDPAGFEPCDAVVRGTPLGVAISLPDSGTGLENRDHVRALRFTVGEEFENDDGGWIEEIYDLWASSDATEIALPTLSLAPGDYVIRCEAMAEPGWEGESSDRLRFSVAPMAEVKPTIAASAAAVTTGAQFSINGYIPGADRTALFCNGEQVGDYEGDSFNHIDVRFESGSYTYTLGVWSPSINDWRKLTGENASITVTVQADPKKGRLAPAVISGFDGTLVRGEDLEFDLEAVENAEDYYLEIHHSSDGRWDWAYDEDIWADQFDGEGKWHVCVPADRFEGREDEEDGPVDYGVGSAFTIQVWAHASGYEQSETRIGFVTVPEPDEEAPAVRLELIDPQPAEGELPVAPVRSDVRFRMTTGLDAPQYAEVFWDNHWQSLWPDEFRGGSYASGEFSRETGDLNPQNVMVRVTPTDPGDLEEGEEIEEWYYSNPVSIGFEQSGEIGAVTGTLNPAMLRRGENLSVGIAVADVDGTDGRTGIRGFDVTVFGRDERGDFWDERQRLFFEGDTETAVIPTTDLETGDYRVEIHAFGKAGYLDQQTDENDPALFFRVKPAIETMATFTATKTGVMTFERYALSAYVPGAAFLELYENDDLWLHYDDEGEHRYWEGDRFTTETVSFPEEGQKHYTLKAYDDRGQPMATDWETIDVNIVSLGPLELPQIDFEGVPDAGKDFNYTVHPAEHIRNYFVEVSNAENEPIDSWEITEGMTEPVTRTIPGTEIVSGGRYHIWIRVEGPRYNAKEATRGFTPIDSSSGDKRLVLPDAITRIDEGAFMGNESLQVVDLRGAKNDVVIGSYAFRGCDNLALVILPPDRNVTFEANSFDEDVVFWCKAGSPNESYLRDTMGIVNIRTAELPF